MLRFIFGLPSSGKTYKVLEEIRERSSKKECVLIVPEQFSFESERAVLKTLGDKAALNVSVMSFSRLCDEIGRNIGGIAGTTLSDSDKVIFMNRALYAVSGELKLWSKYCHSIYFARTMLDTIGEFKINSVTAEMLRTVAEQTESDSLKFKLLDIALIYETYDSLTGERFIDPIDKLTNLYRQLENYRFFENKDVFIDSFKGFTGQQFKIINRILFQADNLTVSLTNDPSLNSEYNVFTNIRAAAEKIRKSAKLYNVAEDKPIILSESRYQSESIRQLERYLSGGEFERKEENGITVCTAATAFDEAEFALRTIRKLVRTENYRYKDFVIIARDAEKYSEAIFSAALKNDVPCFGDKREPLSAFPIAVSVNAAVEFSLKKTSESILRFQKTGLGTLSPDEIAKLENYVLLWGINGSLWENEWNMNPKGFVYGEELTEKQVLELKEINLLRQRAVAPLLKFNETFKNTAPDMARAIVQLILACDAPKKLAELSSRFKNEGAQFSSDVLKQSYDKYMSLLDSLATSFGERQIKKQEFFEALSLAVSLDSVGSIPRMLDEVSFGAADRIRPSRPKVAFILGANQGIFPKELKKSGILGIKERKSLIGLGLDIPDNQIYSAIDENYLVYCNLCCASEKLYISYSEHSLSGEENQPSAFLEGLKENVSVAHVCEPNRKLDITNLPETALSAYSEYCKRSEAGEGEEIKLALENTSQAEKIRRFDEKSAKAPYSIAPQTAKKLYGSNIEMSASKLDVFHKCRFYYFLKYGLRAKKIQPAEFDVLQRGTIVHFVLEKVIEKYKKGLADLSPEEINSAVDEQINIYLDGVLGYRELETERTKFLVSRISRSLKAVVIQLSKEFAQSGFEPVSCELKIGKDGEIPPLKFPFEGGEVSLEGSIDRVDKWNGYIRVVDYKTGTKAFKLPDVLFGQNMQMLIYLYALVRGQGLSDEAAAGILYMPSKRDIKDNGMAMNGLIRSETDIISAMDREMAGEFVPKLRLKNDGTPYKNSTSFISKNDFSEIFDYIEKIIAKTGDNLLSGDIAAVPIDGRETKACKYCDYSGICARESAPCERVPELDNEAVINKMREEKENGI